MLEELREIAPNMYGGQAHQLSWVERVSNSNFHIEQDRLRVQTIQRSLKKVQSLEWSVDSEHPVQVMAQQRQTNRQEILNPMIGFGQVGKEYELAKREDKTVHSRAEALGKRHQRRDRLKEEHRKKHSHNDSYGLLGHRKPKRAVLGEFTREEARREADNRLTDNRLTDNRLNINL